MSASPAMNLRRLALLAAIALAGLAAPATALGLSTVTSSGLSTVSSSSQGTGYAVLGGGGPLTSQIQVPVRIRGGLFVAFRGDPGAGCTVVGVCGYSGSVSWRPPPTGQLMILGFGRGRGRHLDLSLNLLGAGGPSDFQPGGQTTVAVQLAGDPAAACTDAGVSGTSFQFSVRGGRVVFSLGQSFPALLATRCAGPRDGAVLPSLPVPALPESAVRRGHRTIDLTTHRAFQSQGFSGTVQSTIVIRLGQPRRLHISQGRPVTGGPRRAIVITYRASLSGSLVEHVAGAADPAACGPLGACDVTGTETVRPRPRSAIGHIRVTGSRRATYRQLLTALGLHGGHAPAGVVASGFGTLGQGGTLAADIVQGPATCRGTAPLGLGELIMQTAGGRLSAVYGAFAVPGANAAPTICPGPLASPTPFLAAARLPVRRLGAKTVTIRLGLGHRFQDYGYSVRVVPDLTLTLRRVRIRRTMTSAGTF